MRFIDRVDAGRRLARELRFSRDDDVVVLGLPRGGVPVAFEVARALGAPLDVILVRKVGVPYQPELAMAAVGEGGVLVLNEDVVSRVQVSEAELVELERRARRELERRASRFRGGRPPLALRGRVAVVVDDGIATGATARAACRVARAQGAARVVLAVPVCSPDTATELRNEVDELVCLETPTWFAGVGQFYADFRQISDQEVVDLLRRVEHEQPAVVGAPDDAPPQYDEEIEIHASGARLEGRLTVPERVTGVVVFAHGSGSSRHSPRNRYVARVLQTAGLATLLFDLLTPQEELHRASVFDVGLLARRLGEATDWVRHQPACSGLPVGYFGASTGAAAALWAAADEEVAAVVSRGGRPDLAAPLLGEVRAPTLLIVGGRDAVVLELNRRARARMRCESRIVVVPGATHLFEEPGTLEQATAEACAWFTDHFASLARPAISPRTHPPSRPSAWSHRP